MLSKVSILIGLFFLVKHTTLAELLNCTAHTEEIFDIQYDWNDEIPGMLQSQPCQPEDIYIGMASKYCHGISNNEYVNGWGDLDDTNCTPACPAETFSGFVWNKTIADTNATKICPGNSSGAIIRQCDNDAEWRDSVIFLNCSVSNCTAHTDGEYVWNEEVPGKLQLQPCQPSDTHIGIVSKYCYGIRGDGSGNKNGGWGDLMAENCTSACPTETFFGLIWNKTEAETNASQPCLSNSHGAIIRPCKYIDNDAMWDTSVILLNCSVCLPETVDQIMWTLSPPGMQMQPCPPQLGIGYVHRECLNDSNWSTVNTDGCMPLQCPNEVDNKWKLKWSDNTNSGTTATQNCPSGFIGNVTRECSSTGNWGKVDFTNCIIIAHDGFRDQAIIFFNSSEPDIEGAIHLVSQFASYTEGKVLTRDEVDIFNLLARNFVALLREDGQELGDDVVSLINNALHPNNKRGWQDLQQSNGGSEELLYHAESYGYYLAKRDRSTNADIRMDRSARERFAVHARHFYVGDSFTNTTFQLSDSIGGSDNITQITIPGEYLESRAAGDKGEASVIFMAFTTLQDFLPTSNKLVCASKFVSFTCRSASNSETVVISTQLVTTNDIRMANSELLLVNNPIEINFALNVSQYDSSVILNVTCVYWNFSSDFNDVSQEGWIADDTMTTNYYGGNVVSCTSTHLTSFSVLVDVIGSNTEADHEALTYISYIGCAVSIVCLLLTVLILLSLSRKELLTQVFYFIHLNLALSLLFGLIVFVSGIETAASSPGACKAVAVLLHYFFLCAFSWMLCEGIMLYLMLVVVFSKMSKRWWMYPIIGWGLPVVPVAITLGATFDNYEREGGPCWLNGFYSGYHSIWGFIGPMLAIICVNSVILVIVITKLIRNARRKRKNVPAKAKKGEGSKISEALMETQIIARGFVVNATILLPLLGITWVVGLFAINENTLAFAYAFTILNSLQGVFIFVFHVVRSKLVWGKIGTLILKRRKLMATRTKSLKISTLQQQSSALEFSDSKTVQSDHDLQTKSEDDTV